MKSKTVICRYCRKEIDSKAKVCPYCQKNTPKGNVGAVVLISIITILVTAWLTSQGII